MLRWLRFHRPTWLHSPSRHTLSWLVSLLAALTLLAVALPAHAALPAQPPARLQFTNGVAQVQDSVTLNNNKAYLFFGADNQTVRIQLLIQSGTANFEVRGVNNVVYKSLSDTSVDWTYTLPETQDYRITVSTQTQAFYTLVVTLPAGGTPQRITFAPGQTTATVTGNTSTGLSPQYLVAVSANQNVRIAITSASNLANFTVVGVTDGFPYKPSSNPSRDWTFTTPATPATQDYLITVSSPTPVGFTLQITLPGTTPPVGETIVFPPGTNTVVRSGNLTPGVSKLYVFSAAAGQTVRILLTSQPAGSANFSFSGLTDGRVYKTASDPQREWQMVLPEGQNYQIALFSGVFSTYVLEVTLLPVATPMPTPLPTLPVGCTTETIQNGGFESDGFWIFGDSPVPGAYISTPIHAGLRSVRLGITPEMGAVNQGRKSFSSIRQPFEISPFASTAQLRWWQFNRTEEAPTSKPTDEQDKQQVILLAPDLTTVAVLRSTLSNTSAWQQELVDLTPYRGRQLVLYFNAYNDGSGLRTWQFLDDVVLSVCYPAVTPTPVVPTSTPSPIPPTLVMSPTLPPPTSIFFPTSIPITPLLSIAIDGEPRVDMLAPTPPPTITPTPTRAITTWFGRSPQEFVTWIGVMLGVVALIGVIVGALLWWTSRDNTP